MTDIRTRAMLVGGRLGIVDAALVRWLAHARTMTDYLAVQVTGSVFEPLLPQAHVEAFLECVEPVDQVVNSGRALSQAFGTVQTGRESVKTTPWPEDELLAYSVAHVCKQATVSDLAAVSNKLTTLSYLEACYGEAPPGRTTTVGIVSGSFDLIHLGHIQLMQAAKDWVDVLVVLTMHSDSIKRQEKNRAGDRPIYSARDRVTVLSSLRCVDHVVMFHDLDCLVSLQAFCPDYFIKRVQDQPRSKVQEEAEMVTRRGGKTVYLPNSDLGYSSTDVIHWIRQHTASR